jgi:DNA-binding SARP family transcriptional activator
VTVPSSPLWVAALGPLEVRWRGEALNLGGAKQQAVLALLAVEANRVVSVDRLLDWVWHGDSDPRRAGTLQVYVSNLRRILAPVSDALGRALVSTQRPGYVLHLEVDESDLLSFEALCGDGERCFADGRTAEAVRSYRSALALWRGEPLAGLPVDPATAGSTARLELLRVSVFERTAEAELAAGRHREFLSELQTWVSEHPLDERLRGHLMLALYRCGRQADALAAFRAGREILVEHLGIEPSRDLRELEVKILNHDPSLELGASRPRFEDTGSTALRSSMLPGTAAVDLGDRTVSLDKPITTIGRLPDRDVVLDDIGVSRRHAEIRRHGATYRLVDCGSANGTVLNGVRIADHLLSDGDRIRVGATELTFVERLPSA